MKETYARKTRNSRWTPWFFLTRLHNEHFNVWCQMWYRQFRSAPRYPLCAAELLCVRVCLSVILWVNWTFSYFSFHFNLRRSIWDLLHQYIHTFLQHLVKRLDLFFYLFRHLEEAKIYNHILPYFTILFHSVSYRAYWPLYLCGTCIWLCNYLGDRHGEWHDTSP
jgi:hypothetical protein